MKLPPTVLIEDTNFHNSWARAVRYVIRDGAPIVIGDTTEPKPIYDTCCTIELTGNAIRQIEDRELHPQFPFQHIDQYCEEFTREYQEEYIRKPEYRRFTYTYFGRFVEYFRFDQLDVMKHNLSDQIYNGVSSNRNQITTWHPNRDMGKSASPCLQRIWVRHLGDQSVEVHLTWRSRDLYTAWQANIIALVDMLNREVIRPNNCKIVKLVDYSDSLHIYKSDIFAARDVRLIPTFPM